MKKLLSISIIIFFASTLLFVGCNKDGDLKPQDTDILPEKFSVNIPQSLSQETSGTKKSATGVDTLNGNDVYEHLTFFIHVGEAAAKIVEHVITAIRYYGIDKPIILFYQSDDDGRDKKLTVVEDSEYDGVTWDFQLTIVDLDSEGNEDGGIGMQIFWNGEPTKGIALIKPYNLDRVNDGDQRQAMYRIDYSEGGEYGYDAHMIVSIADLWMPPSFVEPYAMSGMKMFVGKEGDIIDVFGNSDHPNAYFFSNELGVGFNWAFVASGSESDDLGVAEVGLPRNDLEVGDGSQNQHQHQHRHQYRHIMLGEYSIKNVFTEAILAWNPNLPPALVDAYLSNTDAPGYFDSFGFVAAGERPGEAYADLDVRLPDLAPYIPSDIRDLTIEFKVD